MTQLSRVKDAETENGNLINADDLDAEIDQLVLESNNQDSRLTTIESGAMTIGGNKNFTGIVTLAGGVNGATQFNQTPYTLGGDPTTPNSLSRRDYVDLLLPKIISGALPEKTSSTQITFYPMVAAERNGTLLMKNTSNTAVSINATGLNGIAQSADQVGTCGTGGASSTTVTFSGIDPTTIFTVNEVLWTASGARRIIALTATTATVESAITLANGTTYRRGGLAPNTPYISYIITNGTTVGFILSNRSVFRGDTLVDLPAGYTTYCEIAYPAITNGSSILLNIAHAGGWPCMPEYRFQEQSGYVNGTPAYSASPSLNILTNGTSGTNADVFLDKVAPKSAIYVWIQATNASAVGHYQLIGNETVGFSAPSALMNAERKLSVITGSRWKVQYNRQNGTGNLNLDLLGFVMRAA